MHRHARASLTAFGAAMLLTVLSASSAAAQLPDLRVASSGVYTEEEAAAGAEVFKTVCSKCHSPAFPIWGSKFQGMWMTGGSLWRLYDFVSIMMPGDAGGTLDPVQYHNVVAYILKINGYPSGQTPLPTTPLDIAYINLDPPPGPVIVPNREVTIPTDGAR